MLDIVIRTEGAYSFKKAETREQFLTVVAGILSAGQRAFVPYKMNGTTTDLQWVVDAGNDWFLFFDEKDSGLVRIRHRYGDRQGLESLAGWLAYRWRGTVVAPAA
jgi:hypothetical protein